MSTAPFEPVGIVMTITDGSNGFTTAFMAKMTDISVDISVEDIDISTFASGTEDSSGSPATGVSATHGYKEFMASALKDAGELNCSIQFSPSEGIPVGGDNGTIVISFPDSESSVWTFPGDVKSYSMTGAIGDAMSADVSIKVGGKIVVT